MKRKTKLSKTAILGAALALIMTVTACSSGNSSTSSTFPNIDDADIPDVLELTVGTGQSTSFTTGITDADYHSVLSLVFSGTTADDNSISVVALIN